MKCAECNGKCVNEDMSACRTCIAPMWCICKRKDVREMVSRLWREANAAEKRSHAQQPTTSAATPAEAASGRVR